MKPFYFWIRTADVKRPAHFLINTSAYLWSWQPIRKLQHKPFIKISFSFCIASHKVLKINERTTNGGSVSVRPLFMNLTAVQHGRHQARMLLWCHQNMCETLHISVAMSAIFVYSVWIWQKTELSNTAAGVCKQNTQINTDATCSWSINNFTRVTNQKNCWQQNVEMKNTRTFFGLLLLLSFLSESSGNKNIFSAAGYKNLNNLTKCSKWL